MQHRLAGWEGRAKSPPRQFGEAVGRSENLADLFRARGLQGMGYELAYEAEKAGHVRQVGVRVERGLIRRLGVNKEGEGIARRFVEVNANTAGLGAGGLQNEPQFGK